MRPLVLILPFALLSITNAGAQVQHTSTSDSQAVSGVKVTIPEQPFHFFQYEAEWISGGYKLSNGWTMKVGPASSGIVARIDKRPPVQLVAVSRDHYVSPDGSMSMEFNQGLQGDGMTMSYMPDQRTAQVIVATATMAQR
jgi:hypothetical protein